MITRRNWLVSSSLLAAAGAIASPSTELLAAAPPEPHPVTADAAKRRALYAKPLPPGLPGKDYMPVEAPNTGTLPFTIVDGVKVFHMVAMEVWNEFCPGVKALCWGYNGMLHPVIEAVEGERVRIYVTNRIAAPTTVHWHGLYVPSGMDGVGGLTQKPIPPGETYKYEFTLVESGTKMYHSHHDEMTQIALGMTGLFVIHPRSAGHAVDRDFAIMLQEWRLDPGAYRPNPLEMTDFNLFTMNAKSFPSTHPLVVKTNQKVRIRLGNLGPMDHHPIHLHNYSFQVVASDGGEYPVSAQQPATTVLVPVGTTRTVEFIADNPGDWALHCHMTHHVMNQMGHNVPNMIGVQSGDMGNKLRDVLPGYMTMGATGMAGGMDMGTIANTAGMALPRGPYGDITMGGMFTVLKVRDQLKSYADPGWYQPPAGTLALPAATDDLKRDGINPMQIPKPIAGPAAPTIRMS